jgi:CHAT domain-containing protein
MRPVTRVSSVLILAAGFALARPTSVLAQPGNAVEAESFEQAGNQLNARGDWQNAIPSWRRSLAMRQTLRDRGGAARLTGTIAMAYFEHQDYSAAIEFFRPFLELTRQLGERRAEGIALTYLGNASVFISRYSEAATLLRDALVIVRNFRDLPGEGVVLSGLATAEFNLGQYTNASNSYQQLLELGRQLNDAQLSGFALNGLANTAGTLGDGVRAMLLYEQALQSVARTHDRRTEGRTYNGIGNVFLSRGDYPRARDNYQRGLGIAREIRDREGESNALGNLGNVYALLGKRTEAMQAQQDSLRIARERGDVQGELEALNGVGLAAERLGDNGAAIAAYRRADEFARQAQNRPGSVIALTNLGGALLTAGTLDESERALRAAALIADSLRAEDLTDMNRVSYFETQLVTYRQLRDLQIARGNPAESLEFAERGRAQALRVQVARRLADKDGQRLASAAPLPVQGIRQLALARHITFVEYAIDERPKALLAWVVSADGKIQLRRTALQTPLAALVQSARSSVGVRGLDSSAPSRGLRVVAQDNGAVAPELRKLYQLLIAPIEDLLPADPAMLVVFVPERELFLVPFAALLDREGRYLIERHALASAPSIEVMNLAATRPIQAQRVESAEMLIVGNPTMPQVRIQSSGELVRLPQLPGTEREAGEIAQLLGGRTLLAGQATKKRVTQQMATARLVHLATHGLLDDLGFGLPGAIALAPADGDSGLLTTAEIAALTVKADLVVLSACDTGRGELSGDGVIGLSRSLLAAGAASAIVSLWQVPDEPTATLMISFYRQLRQGVDKAQALRTAMLMTRQQFPDPINWAAFVLIGDTRAVE